MRTWLGLCPLSFSFYSASNATPLDLSTRKEGGVEDGQKTGIEDEGSGGGMHKSGVGEGDSPYDRIKVQWRLSP